MTSKHLAPSQASRHLPALVCVAATLARALLAWNTPVVIGMYPAAQCDDLLFMNEAWSIMGGRWLGAYFKWTLAKKPGFPLFLALVGATHVRYQLLVILLYALAALAFVRAIRPLVPGRWVRAAVFVAILFAPSFLTKQYFRHVYRENLAATMTLLVISAYIAIYLRRRDGWKKILPWALGGSCAYAYFSVFKESSSWALPFIGVCSLVILVGWVVDLRRAPDAFARGARVANLVACAVLLVLPLACGRAASAAVRSLNGQKYGAPVTSVRFDGELARVCSDLSAIDAGDGAGERGIWISRAALDQALAASPTLATAQDSLRAAWDTWAQSFDGREIYGDMCYWALIDGYAQAGGCQDGGADQAFWGKVADELEAGFASGGLRRHEGLRISQVAPAIGPDDAPRWAYLIGWANYKMLGFGAMQVDLIGDDWQPVTNVNSYVDLEVAARDTLGGGTVLFGQTPEELSSAQHLAMRLDHKLGTAGIWVWRLATLGLVPALVALAVLERRHPGHRLEVALVVTGLLLSALAFIAAIVWYNSYQLGIYDMASFERQVYSYCTEYHALLMMAYTLVYARLLTVLPSHYANAVGE